MSLLNLPNEIIQKIGFLLDTEADISALSRTSHHLHFLLISHLYQYNSDNSDASSLEWAVQNNRPGTLQRAIDSGLSFHNKYSVFRLVGTVGNEEILDILLAKDIKHYLSFAMVRAVEANRLHIVRKLLEEGIDVDISFGIGDTGLVLACKDNRIEVAKLFIQYGAKMQGYTGWKALRSATEEGNISLLEFMLDYDAFSLPLLDESGNPLLAIAAGKGKLGVVKILIDRGAATDINAVDRRQYSVVACAAEGGSADVVSLLLEKGAAVNSGSYIPALHLSIRGEHVDASNALIEGGADINALCPWGRTALAHAAVLKLPKAVKLLLDHGADPNYEDSHALISAVHEGPFEIVRQLLDHGANLEILRDHNTPLCIAAYNDQDSIARALLEQGASVVDRPEEANSPLYHAAFVDNIDMARILLRYGANANTTSMDGTAAMTIATLPILELLVFYGANIDFQYEMGMTELMISARRGDPTRVEALLTYGASLHLTEHYGSTALSIAVRNGHVAVVAKLLDAEWRTNNNSNSITGNSINRLDGFGRSITSWAIGIGSNEILDLLKQHSNRIDYIDTSTLEETLQFGSLRHITVPGRNLCYCDICNRRTPHDSPPLTVYCEVCSPGSIKFIICDECYNVGMRCLDNSHVLQPYACDYDHTKR